MPSNPTRHVIIALMLTTILFVIAGDRWSERIGTISTVRPAARK